MHKVWVVIKIIFWAMITIAAVFIIVSSLKLFGFRMYVVKSGSMEPKIRTGSIVVDKSEANYKTGDVITFKVKDNKDTVTHRIVAVKDENGVVTYTSKGDANRTPDPDPVSKNNVQGKVAFSVPFIGYLIAFIKTLPGLVIFIFIPAVIIVSEEISNIKTETGKIKNKRRAKKEQKPDETEAELPKKPVEPEPKKEPPKYRVPPKRPLIQ